MLKVMKKKQKKKHRNPSRCRFAKIDQPNHRSASMFLLNIDADFEYGWKLFEIQDERENARRLCRNFTMHIFLSKVNVRTCKNRSLCVIVHMYTMQFITYGDRLSYWWLDTYGGILSYRGLHETGAMQKRYYISCVI